MATASVTHRAQQHLLLLGVSRNYYERTLEQIGDRPIRVNFLNGDMEIISPVDNPFPEDYLLLDPVSWDYYERTLDEIGDRPLRVTYCDGRMEIMSPLPKHEKVKSAIGRLIELMSLELDIAVLPLGSTTFRREDRDAGLEPDECYYVRNAVKVREMERFHADQFPPPDLAVEVDVFGRSVAREPIYARLEIPEVWRYRNSRLQVRTLEKKRYRDAAASLAFPFLPMDQFEAFLKRMSVEEQNPVLRDFRAWLGTLSR